MKFQIKFRPGFEIGENREVFRLFAQVIAGSDPYGFDGKLRYPLKIEISYSREIKFIQTKFNRYVEKNKRNFYLLQVVNVLLKFYVCIPSDIGYFS